MTDNKELIDSVVKNLELDTSKRCQTAGEWLELVVPNLRDVDKLIKALEERYPKDEHGQLPRMMQIKLRLAEFNVAPNTREKVRVLKAVLAVAGGITGLGAFTAGIGAALGWSSAGLLAFKGFVATGVAVGGWPLILGGAGSAALWKVAEYFSNRPKSQLEIVMETLKGISKLVKGQDPQFWEENKDLWKYDKK